MSAQDIIAGVIDDMDVMTTSQAHGSAALILSHLRAAGFVVARVPDPMPTNQSTT
jgi:hypothetical protein